VAIRPISQHVEQIAAMLRVDARTLRRAVDIGDMRRAGELAGHIEALAAELAPEVPVLAGRRA
jgi:hypothetical protein